MEFQDGKIILNKDLNSLDKFVIDFTTILNSLEIKYVVISGYVPILFGRNRASEDVDLIIEKLTISKFLELWKELEEEFECIITGKADEAYNEYLLNDHAIRFSKKGTYIPNMELKFPKTDLDNWTLSNRKEVTLNNKLLWISQLELQISFKVFLGSEKDIEDAKFLFNLFKERLNLSLLEQFNRKLNIEKEYNKYIK